MSETADNLEKINAMQRRLLAGEDPSADEMKEVIALLRGERKPASGTPTRGRTKAAPVVLDLAALFANRKPKTE